MTPPELVSAEGHGWPVLRAHCIQRDGGCIATRTDLFGADASDTCDGKLEFDHVKESLRAGVRAVNDEAHGVMVCSYHHRGPRWRSDSKAHRAVIRRYLSEKYPEAWAR